MILKARRAAIRLSRAIRHSIDDCGWVGKCDTVEFKLPDDAMLLVRDSGQVMLCEKGAWTFLWMPWFQRWLLKRAVRWRLLSDALCAFEDAEKMNG